MFKNIWRKLSSGQKITMMGSLLLILSLFLNWFSDKDVFRSGDTYTALGGPLYLPGLTMLLAATFALGLVVLAALRNKRVMALGLAKQGKMQMLAGFLSMYLLIVINSVFFHPRFGLNILEKKTEIGVMLALVATVLICVGGYLSYRKKFEQEEAPAVPVRAAVEQSPMIATVAQSAPAFTAPAPARSAAAHSTARQHVPLESVPAMPATVGTTADRPATPLSAATSALASSSGNSTTVPGSSAPAGGYFSERDPRGKTEYERLKLYENLKRTMVRDTLTPDQRRKLREKEVKDNAFSANFGKGGLVGGAKRTTAAPTTTAEASDKKPQMYRMDL